MNSATTAAPILILKTGDVPPGLEPDAGDFEDWVRQGLSLAGARTVVLDPRKDPGWPDLRDIAGVVVTGSPAMVTDREPWSERSAAWLRDVIKAEVPVLGICYGHQLLADALGGEVTEQPDGPEVGTIRIALNPAAESDPLLMGMPLEFDAQLSHRQTVSRLPADAVSLASSEAEPNQAVRFAPQAWGLQFHPEFSPRATLLFVDRQAPYLARHGKDAEPIRAAVAETPAAARVLPRFAALALAAYKTRPQATRSAA